MQLTKDPHCHFVSEKVLCYYIGLALFISLIKLCITSCRGISHIIASLKNKEDPEWLITLYTGVHVLCNTLHTSTYAQITSGVTYKDGLCIVLAACSWLLQSVFVKFTLKIIKGVLIVTEVLWHFVGSVITFEIVNDMV